MTTLRIRGMAGAALLCASAAQAAFTGSASSVSFVGAHAGECALDVYATFDAPGWWLFSVSGTDIALHGVTFDDVIHDPDADGIWNPNPPNPDSIDSYVTIGSIISSANGT